MTQVLDEARKARLFWASCFALIATSVAFGVITSSMGDFQTIFNLTPTDAGWVGGAALGGFAVAIILLGPVIEKIGIAVSLKLAFVCHILGIILMMYADGFSGLMAGASIIALGNGCVEAGCNPLVATIYSDNKTTKLNQFHVFWPVGIIIGALFGFWVSNAAAATGAEWSLFGLSVMQAKLGLVLIPTLIYGFMFLGQEIPQTERVQSNVSDEEVTASVTSPLFILMLCCMGLTATLELGPGRWMGAIMEPTFQSAMGEGTTTKGAGILVLVYGSGLMAVLRYFAGGFVHRFSPTGLLFGSAVLGGVGLFAMTYAENFGSIFLTATVFYAGVCFFWPTMLGFVSERMPNSGAMGLCLMGGAGMLVVGYAAAPAIGAIQEYYINTFAAANPAAAADAATAYAGKMAFRWVAALAIPLALLFFNLNKRFGNVAASAVGSSSSVADNEPKEVQNSF
ncbi:MAG: MFS transporter [Planctomycetota bacterium]